MDYVEKYPTFNAEKNPKYPTLKLQASEIIGMIFSGKPHFWRKLEYRERTFLTLLIKDESWNGWNLIMIVRLLPPVSGNKFRFTGMPTDDNFRQMKDIKCSLASFAELITFHCNCCNLFSCGYLNKLTGEKLRNFLFGLFLHFYELYNSWRLSVIRIHHSCIDSNLFSAW